ESDDEHTECRKCEALHEPPASRSKGRQKKAEVVQGPPCPRCDGTSILQRKRRRNVATLDSDPVSVRQNTRPTARRRKSAPSTSAGSMSRKRMGASRCRFALRCTARARTPLERRPSV